MNKSGHEETFQNRKKGAERVQTKLGKMHVDYWYPRVKKRTYVGRDGVTVEVPYWQARLKSAGRTMCFNLETTNRAEAVAKARDIYVYLIANECEATLERFKPKSESSNDDLTVDEFAELYRKEVELVEYPPLRRTIEPYIASFLLI